MRIQTDANPPSTLKRREREERKYVPQEGSAPNPVDTILMYFFIFYNFGIRWGRKRSLDPSPIQDAPFQLNKAIYENTILCKVIKYLRVFSCEDGQFSYPLFFSVIVKLYMKIYVYNVYIKSNKLNCSLRTNKSCRRQIISRTSLT